MDNGCTYRPDSFRSPRETRFCIGLLKCALGVVNPDLIGCFAVAVGDGVAAVAAGGGATL
jgi:hypothetical protein